MLFLLHSRGHSMVWQSYKKKIRAHICMCFLVFFICLFFCVQKETESNKLSFFWEPRMNSIMTYNLKRYIFAFCGSIIQNVFFGTIFLKNVLELPSSWNKKFVRKWSKIWESQNFFEPFSCWKPKFPWKPCKTGSNW